MFPYPHESILFVFFPVTCIRLDKFTLFQFRPDRIDDFQLAKHIAQFHQNGATPATLIYTNPLDTKTLRKYIAQCQKKMPIIPRKLTNYITENYVYLRKESR